MVCVCVFVCSWLSQVAGLDVGWHTLLDLQENPETRRLELTRQVLPGTYPFKFIIDGRWVANYDIPTYQVHVKSGVIDTQIRLCHLQTHGD